jgi:hypothetical protein
MLLLNFSKSTNPIEKLMSPVVPHSLAPLKLCTKAQVCEVSWAKIYCADQLFKRPCAPQKVKPNSCEVG